MPKPKTVVTDAFFKERIAVSSDGCWEWQRSLFKLGYACAKVGGKTMKAHRLSWEFYRGPIPDGMIICHHCDNRKCINPDHLFIGTTQDNVDDKMRKGRFVTTPGEKNGYAKLTAEQVRAIRADSRAQHRIAADYGISQSNVSVIKQGKAWRGAASTAAQIASTEAYLNGKCGAY
jgi:hypothetical protein